MRLENTRGALSAPLALVVSQIAIGSSWSDAKFETLLSDYANIQMIVDDVQYNVRPWTMHRLTRR